MLLTSRLWVHAVDRAQKYGVVLLIDLSVFQTYGTILTSHDGVRIVWSETSTTWINIANVYHFSSVPQSNCTRLVLTSEKSGFRHLYQVTIPNEQSHEIEIQQLTQGDWSVIDFPVEVVDRRIYFVGRASGPLETHAYVLDCDTGVVTLLTETGFSHWVKVVSGYMVEAQSNLAGMERLSIKSLHASRQINCAVILIGRMDDKQDNPQPLITIPAGQIFEFENRHGDLLHGMIYHPSEYVTGRKYPTLCYCYGGPRAQLVENVVSFPRHIRFLIAAQLGFVVVLVDGRGSNGSGVQSEAHYQRGFGTFELEDQIDGLLHCAGASMQGVVDLARIAISGWSYGGYLSALALCRYPDVFKLAIAGAPVVDFANYDSAYTERYMGMPGENAEAYARSSLLSHADKFPKMWVCWIV